MNENKSPRTIRRENAYVLLNNYIEKDFIFIDYFIEVVNFFDEEIYEMMAKENFFELFKQKEVFKAVKEVIKDYLQEIWLLKNKSEYICAWMAKDDEMEYFHEIMQDEHIIERLKCFSLDEFKKADKLIKKKRLTLEKALRTFGVYEEPEDE